MLNAATLKGWLPVTERSRLALLLAGLVLAHIVSAVSVPLLSGEAYYWLWGQHLAAGYVDHPPMVGWLSAVFGGWVLGSPLAARSSAIILSALSTFVLYLLARELFPKGQAAWRAALLVSLTPAGFGNGIVLQPDNALLLFCALTWLLFWRAANQPGIALGQWAMTGVCCGLALLSKFHAWVLLPPLWIFLALSPAHRSRLRTPGPWVAAAIALLVLSPNLIWNARHDWLTYRFQWNRSSLGHSDFESNNPLIYLFGPFLMLSPLVYPAVVWTTWRELRGWFARRDPVVLYLLCSGIPLLLFLAFCSLRVTISLHWSMVGFMPLLILLAGLLENGDSAFGPNYVRRMMNTCFLLTAILFVLPWGLRLVPVSAKGIDKANDVSLARLKKKMIDWKVVGRHARRLRDKAERKSGSPVVLMADSWHLAALIAFHAQLPQEVFTYTSTDAHNFDLWRRKRGGLAGEDAIVIIEKNRPNQVHSKLKKKYDSYYRTIGPSFEDLKIRPSMVFYSDGTREEYVGVDVTRPRLNEYLFLYGTSFKPPQNETFYAIR